ncbi:DUF3592 domain-containing protein [Marinobacterium arenosum]|uniref:DUF3592 domain-containing protein n=1 Tax=Marinobacterium arenosum TaxID=2862496 RepID=UPI001C987051|nr:DUF3592 domain-containing protein [Marinobacterium arenosum]MBY4678753.1 hypothetical protein [Marinobacterium arenosum]
MINKSEAKGFVIRVLAVVALVVCAVVVYDRATVIVNSSLVPATITDCGSEWVKVSDTPSGLARPTRYRDQVQYYPKAVTANGDEAVGWLMMPTRALCSQMVGKDVSVFVHHSDPSENRIHSFLQFWAMPLFILAFAISVPLSSYSITGVRIFGVAFALSFTGLVLDEIGMLETDRPRSAANEGTQEANEVASPSKKALDRCVFTSMFKEKVEHRHQIKSLLCMDEQISDLSSIADLYRLQELYLQGNALSSLAGVQPLTQLRKLSVAGNKMLTSTKGIENLLMLEEFQANKASISDLSGLDKLSDLRVVGLMMNEISDVSVFSALSKLEDVTLNYNRIQDISAFANKPALKNFMAYSNDISDVSPLYGNTAMSAVGLRGRKEIPCEQIARLRSVLDNSAVVYGPKHCD